VVCSGGTGRKEDEVPRFELVLAVRMPQGRRARDDQQPLLIGILIVVGADCLARRQLVNAEPGAGRADQRPDPGAVPPEAVRQLWTRLTCDRAEVGSLNRFATHQGSLS
jgi:hypothetical protein